MRIAILEDDPAQTALLEEVIASLGHDCFAFHTGASFIKAISRDSFDLFMLDWQLPEMSGVEVLRWIRANLKDAVPVVFVTSRDTAEDVVHALALGADDYLKKPVTPTELRARVNALLRRAYRQDSSAVARFPPFLFDVRARRAEVAGTAIALTQKEFDLALFLFRNVGRLLSRTHLFEAVWGRTEATQTRTLDTHLSRIRVKLGLRPENGYQLTPVHTYGYRLEQIEHASSLK